MQYTWAVPQNLAGLFGLMGGDRVAVSELTPSSPAQRHPFRPLRLGRERADEAAPSSTTMPGNRGRPSRPCAGL